MPSTGSNAWANDVLKCAPFYYSTGNILYIYSYLHSTYSVSIYTLKSMWQYGYVLWAYNVQVKSTDSVIECVWQRMNAYSHPWYVYKIHYSDYTTLYIFWQCGIRLSLFLHCCFCAVFAPHFVYAFQFVQFYFRLSPYFFILWRNVNHIVMTVNSWKSNVYVLILHITCRNHHSKCILSFAEKAKKIHTENNDRKGNINNNRVKLSVVYTLVFTKHLKSNINKY